MNTADIMPRVDHASHAGGRPLMPDWSKSEKLVTSDLIVNVFRSLDEVEAEWRSFEKHAVASCYQRFDFVSAWLKNIGFRNGYSPYIVIGQNRKGETAFIWQLVLKRQFGHRVLSWPCGRHSNYNLGLYNRLSMKDMGALQIRDILRAAKNIHRFDAVHLLNQPEMWDGSINPFMELPHIPSPSFAYCIDLRQGYERYLETFRSAKFRKRLRWQERKLCDLGDVTYKRAQTCEEAIHFVDVHFAQKSSRFLSTGKSDPFAEVGLKAFITDLATRDPESTAPPLELHALLLDDEFLALYGGATSERRFSAFFNSIDIRYAKQVSVGDMLLARLAMNCDERYLDGLDLGVGEAVYKTSWCNQEDRMFDTFIAVTFVGWISATIMKLARRAKRKIKQTPFLWRLARKFV